MCLNAYAYQNQKRSVSRLNSLCTLTVAEIDTGLILTPRFEQENQLHHHHNRKDVPSIDQASCANHTRKEVPTPAAQLGYPLTQNLPCKFQPEFHRLIDFIDRLERFEP